MSNYQCAIINHVSNNQSMIIDINALRGYAIKATQQQTWEAQFINGLLRANSTLAKTSSSNQGELTPFIEYIDNQKMKHTQVILPKYPHSFYSSFVPLRRSNYSGLSEYSKEFSILNYFEENSYDQLADLLMEDITESLTKPMKSQQEVNFNYNPKLSLTSRLLIYANLLKFGTAVIQDYGNIQSWMYALFQSSSCFHREQYLRHNLSITVESTEPITLETLSRTMKNLYCPICFIYDCNIHNCSLVSTQYVCMKNKIRKQIQLRSAITMASGQNCKFNLCSEQCFRAESSGKQGNVPQIAGLSEIAKSLIAMGLQLFSYNPCEIKLLFATGEVSCVTIFKYLINQFGLKNKIDSKMYASEIEMLRNEQTKEVFLNPKPSLKRKKNKKKNGNVKALSSVSICHHHFINKLSEDHSCRNCICKQRGFCIPACLCSDECRIPKKGCQCRAEAGCCFKESCPCFRNKIECDPEVCRKCCSSKSLCCSNISIRKNKKKKIKIGKSSISGAGLGAFAGESLAKDQLVITYLGEKVNSQVEEIRDFSKNDDSFYNFETNGLTLDARYIGNKARFINHGNSGYENLRVQLVHSKDEQWIAFYAIRDIDENEQLLFNYDGTGQLALHHQEKYPFILKSK